MNLISFNIFACWWGCIYQWKRVNPTRLIESYIIGHINITCLYLFPLFNHRKYVSQNPTRTTNRKAYMLSFYPITHYYLIRFLNWPRQYLLTKKIAHEMKGKIWNVIIEDISFSGFFRVNYYTAPGNKTILNHTYCRERFQLFRCIKCSINYKWT